MSVKMSIPMCPECGKMAVTKKRKLITSDNADNEWVWTCPDYPKCDMYVGCHPGTIKPLGTLANQELRSLRWRAHKAMDTCWKSDRMTRDEAYEELQIVLELGPKEAHIDRLNRAQCEKVIKVFDGRKDWKVPRII